MQRRALPLSRPRPQPMALVHHLGSVSAAPHPSTRLLLSPPTHAYHPPMLPTRHQHTVASLPSSPSAGPPHQPDSCQQAAQRHGCRWCPRHPSPRQLMCQCLCPKRVCKAPLTLRIHSSMHTSCTCFPVPPGVLLGGAPTRVSGVCPHCKGRLSCCPALSPGRAAAQPSLAWLVLDDDGSAFPCMAGARR